MKNDKVKSILFAGVGGQGILRASDILCEVMMEAGYDVKKSEVHGMAQRGGCVTSHVRYGAKVYSPLAEPGTIETLVSFEEMEALRYLKSLSADASIILNTEQINPPAVNLGDSQYPNDIIEFLKNNASVRVDFANFSENDIYRAMDFIQGACYALGLKPKFESNKVFLIEQ